jgi:hypothetical protein
MLHSGAGRGRSFGQGRGQADTTRDPKYRLPLAPFLPYLPDPSFDSGAASTARASSVARTALKLASSSRWVRAELSSPILWSYFFLLTLRLDVAGWVDRCAGNAGEDGIGEISSQSGMEMGMGMGMENGHPVPPGTAALPRPIGQSACGWLYLQLNHPLLHACMFLQSWKSGVINCYRTCLVMKHKANKTYLLYTRWFSGP